MEGPIETCEYGAKVVLNFVRYIDRVFLPKSA